MWPTARFRRALPEQRTTPPSNWRWASGQEQAGSRVRSSDGRDTPRRSATFRQNAQAATSWPHAHIWPGSVSGSMSPSADTSEWLFSSRASRVAPWYEGQTTKTRRSPRGAPTARLSLVRPPQYLNPGATHWIVLRSLRSYGLHHCRVGDKCLRTNSQRGRRRYPPETLRGRDGDVDRVPHVF